MRTFQHRVTINDMGAIVVFIPAAFSCLWHRMNSPMVILGFLLIVVTIRVVNRIIHTEYVLTDNGVLLVKTGRVGLTKRVLLSDVKTIKKRLFTSRLGCYTLLEMMNDNVVNIQPDNVDNFSSALEKQLEKEGNEVRD